MEAFQIGENVAFKKDFVEGHVKTNRHRNQACQDIYKFKDSLFVIVKIIDSVCVLACMSSPDWGVDQGDNWQGQPVKTWRVSMKNLERRDFNTISLYELNRGL